jgi:hypothetical protein
MLTGRIHYKERAIKSYFHPVNLKKTLPFKVSTKYGDERYRCNLVREAGHPCFGQVSNALVAAIQDVECQGSIRGG